MFPARCGSTAEREYALPHGGLPVRERHGAARGRQFEEPGGHAPLHRQERHVLADQAGRDKGARGPPAPRRVRLVAALHPLRHEGRARAVRRWEAPLRGRAQALQEGGPHVVSQPLPRHPQRALWTRGPRRREGSAIDFGLVPVARERQAGQALRRLGRLAQPGDGPAAALDPRVLWVQGRLSVRLEWPLHERAPCPDPCGAAV
mmetsp:Transcript_104822/g.296572  ORF Transcript_104822/g.296572 Transcript_104822/m.296572 type:complete len:204 (+) Transcript_104822:831-1442(+)